MKIAVPERGQVALVGAANVQPEAPRPRNPSRCGLPEGAAQRDPGP